jgi:uncharacterized membrane protein
MKYKSLTIIFIIAFLSSLILSLQPVPTICTGGCDTVQTSPYAYTFGIKNSYFGVAIFAILTIVAMHHMKKPHQHKKKLVHLSVIIGSMVAAYFIYLQVFVLKAYCTYCMVVDIAVLVGLAIVIWKWKD